MSRPDDFDLHQKRSDSEEERAGQKQSAQWYRISYQNENGTVPPVVMPMEEEGGWGHLPPKRGNKLFLIAVCITLCFSPMFLGGLGGALITSSLLQGGGDPTVNPMVGESSGLNGGYLPETGGSTYDYASVELSKNDGSALLGSENGSAGSNAKSMISAVAAVKDSVVEIMTTAVSNYGKISAGAGSGVIIHEDGIIVTNNHVVADTDEIFVRLTNGNTYKAFLRGWIRIVILPSSRSPPRKRLR